MKTFAFILFFAISACKSTSGDRSGSPESNLRADQVKPLNGVMMQYFHWYNTKDDELWKKISKEAKSLGESGITALWLPPAYKGSGGEYDVGYGVYDVYDLGEFNQKGSVRTKYGTKDDYIKAIADLRKHGIQSYADVVLNHRFGADAKERVKARRVKRENRLEDASDLDTIEAWTVLDFAGRAGKYSNFKMTSEHFSGTDYNAIYDDQYTKKMPEDRTEEEVAHDKELDRRKKEEEQYIFLFEGKGWSSKVAPEKGNYDYLMASDVDFSHPKVRDELNKWGQWYVKTTGVDGLRIDAVKHIDFTFWGDFVKGIEKSSGKNMFVVGEYLDMTDVQTLNKFIENAGQDAKMHVFDFPLHTKFYQASTGNGGFDMASLFEGTIQASNPTRAVTLVDNHDTQPCQAFGYSAVLDWFKPLAYAFILLNKDGYPSLFYPDYYGMDYRDGNCAAKSAGHKKTIDKLLAVRRDIAFGGQYNYGRGDNGDNVVGFIRDGGGFSKGLAMLINDGEASSRYMKINQNFAGNEYCNIFFKHCVKLDENGGAQFNVGGGGLSVYVDKSIADKYSN